MKKRISGLLSTILIFVLLFSSNLNVSAATNCSVDEAMSWLNGLVGTKVGTGQCVALIKSYYSYLGVSSVLGNACDYATNSLPSGWSRVKGGAPQKGDILVYTGAKYGHVAIYAGGTVSYHQNMAGQYVEKKTNWEYNKSWYSSAEGGTKSYWGYIRPNWKGDSPVVPDPPKQEDVPVPVASGFFAGKQIVAMSPNKISISSTSYVSAGDICILSDVNSSTGNCSVTYPSGSSDVFKTSNRKTVTLSMNNFISYNAGHKVQTVTAPSGLTVYPTSSMSQNGTNWALDAGDTYYTVNYVDGKTEILYYCNRGAHNGYWKLGWVYLDYCYLDLNGYLNNSSSGNIYGYGYADVIVNGNTIVKNATDFYQSYPYGSTYEIKNITALDGYQYNGVYSGATSGKIMGTTNVVLSFSKKPPTLTKIYVSADATKQEYYVGESFDKSGLVISALYSDGSITNVTNSCSFSGFSSSTVGTKQVTASYGGKQASFYVSVSEKTYTVTFYPNGGSTPTASKTVTHNSTYGTLPTPTRTGYSFAGWYTEASGGSQIISTTTVSITKDQTLYAHWAKETYSLIIRLYGGTWNGSTENQTISMAYGDSIKIPNPEKPGYEFAGWDMDFSGSGHKLEPYGIPVHNDPCFSNSGTLGIYNNAGNGAVQIEKVSKDSDFQMSSAYMMKITTSGTARPGLGGFVRTYNSKSGGVFYHVISAKIPVGYYIQRASNECGNGAKHEWLTSQAGTGKWETYIYKTTCGTTGTFSSFGHVFISKSISYLSEETATSPVTWYVGYSEIFDATGVNSSGNSLTMGTGSVYLHARYRLKDITLQIRPAGGTYYNVSGEHTENTNYTKLYGQKTEIGEVKRTGYQFVCWEIEGNGTIEPWGTPVSNKCPKFSDGNTLSLYNNAGTDAVNLEIVQKEATCPTTGANMMKITTLGTAQPGLGGFADFANSKSGGVFYHILTAKIPEGYYLHKISNPCGDGSKQEWITANRGTGDWETYIYKTTCGTTGSFGTFGHVYISKFSSASDSLQQETASAPVTWYVGYSNVLDATDIDQQGNNFTFGTNNAYLQAMWNRNKYTIEFDANGGTGNMEKLNCRYDKERKLPNNTLIRAGYTFKGWNTKTDGNGSTYEDCASIKNLTTENNGNVKLFAQWEENPTNSKGDVNGDGEIDIADALLVMKHDAGLTIIDEAFQQAADVNNDGEIDIADAILIMKYDAGLINKF